MPSFDINIWQDSLDPTDRWLIDWRTQENLPVKEIAARSGLPVRVVARRLRHLRDRLVKQYRADNPGA